MTRDERDPERDDELHRLLDRWSAPVVPDGMDERVLQAFRRQAGTGREPWWSRLFTASVRVPVPVALGVLMLLIVTAALALRPVAPPPTAAGPLEPVQAARRGDVPVVSRTSLAGFQPVTEVTATVVTERSETRQ